MIKELKNITNTIVDGVEPVAINLFGSPKNFELKPHSDLDSLVERIKEAKQNLYEGKVRTGSAKDLFREVKSV